MLRYDILDFLKKTFWDSFLLPETDDRNSALVVKIYLQIASTRLADELSPDDKGARNSLLLYFAIINLSLSSWDEAGSGFGPFSFCSQILFAIVLPATKGKRVKNSQTVDLEK